MGNGKYGFLIPSLVPIFIIMAFVTNRPALFLYIISFAFLFSIVLDCLVPRDKLYCYDEVIATPENDGRLSSWIYQLLSGSFLILHLIALILGMYIASYEYPLSPWIFYLLPFGFEGSVVLTVCHEYFHKESLIEKNIARFFGSLEFWSVHEYEHLFYHHHPDISCTPDDLSHARINQSVYSYVYHAIIHNYVYAWEKQKELCSLSGVPFFNILKNPLLKWLSVSAIIIAIIYVFFGYNGVLFFLAQAALSMFIFIASAYNQHYGLTRRLKADGTYEEFTFMNVWAFNHFISSKQAFNATHHAHHHLFQLCRYPHLKAVSKGPLYPFGLSMTFLLCLIPGLWYRIVNPRVKEIYRLRDEYESKGQL